MGAVPAVTVDVDGEAIALAYGLLWLFHGDARYEADSRVFAARVLLRDLLTFDGKRGGITNARRLSHDQLRELANRPGDMRPPLPEPEARSTVDDGVQSTPGPWKPYVERSPLDGSLIVTEVRGRDGRPVAIIPDNGNRDERLANLLMTRAALDLFNAAEAAAVNALDIDGSDRVSISREHLNDLYTALAKAGR